MSVKETYVCDSCGEELSGKPDPTQVGWDGELFTLDLCAECDASTEKTVKGIVKNGRSTGRYQTKTTATPPRNTKSSMTPSAQIRAWAAAEGIPIGVNGRIPTAIQEQFHAAHSRGSNGSNGSSARRKAHAA